MTGHFHKHAFAWAAALTMSWTSLAGAQSTTRVQERELTVTARLTATAFAESSHIISNPLAWPQVQEVAPDGGWVESNEVVTVFDSTGPSNNLVRLQLRRAVSSAETERRLTDIDNRNLAARDKLLALQDKLAVVHARRKRLEAMPDPDEVAIAESEWRIALMAWQATSNDCVKAEDRLSRTMISEAQFETYRSAFEESAVRLRHATFVREYSRLPASALDLERVALEAANEELEIAKVEHEIRENVTIGELKKTGARGRLRRMDRDIRESQDDVQKAVVRAPLAGHIVYSKDFRTRVLNGGRRMWKRAPYMRIPDARTLAFKGVLEEDERRHFEAGDPVEIHVVGYGEHSVSGTIDSFASIARDRGEKEEEGWGESKEYGVKVYDVTIRPDRIEPWMRLGMHAECIVTAKRPVKGPTVPLRFVRMDPRGRFTLAVDGVYQRVEGEVLNGYFLLHDADLTGRAVEEFAEVIEQTDDDASADNFLFDTSGELVPAEMVNVTVKRIYAWQKITWLIGEDTSVTQGQVVARLDSKETWDEIEEWEERLTEAVSDREAKEQNAALEKREHDCGLAVAVNALRMAEIDYLIARAGTDSKGISAAARDLALAQSAGRTARAALTRLEARADDLVSPVERTRAERAVRRAALKLESAQIRLARVKAGSDPVEIERKRVTYEEKRLKVEVLRKTIDTSKFESTMELDKARRREAHRERGLATRRMWLENLTIVAPCDGLVRYNKIWSSGVVSKIRTGSTVGSGFLLMHIADVSRMEVRAAIFEGLYPEVHEGMRVEITVPSLTDEMLSGRIREVEFLFEQKQKKDAKLGLYSSHEALGETVFYVRVDVESSGELLLKPGAVAHIRARRTGAGR